MAKYECRTAVRKLRRIEETEKSMIVRNRKRKGYVKRRKIEE